VFVAVSAKIVAVDTDGQSEVVGHGPPKVNAAAPGHSLGWSIDWLPDGRLLITGKELVRREPDGSMIQHADPRDITTLGWNEIVVDGRGNVYVNSIRFRVHRRRTTDLRDHRARSSRRLGPQGR
jgi:hypothetical protein